MDQSGPQFRKVKNIGSLKTLRRRMSNIFLLVEEGKMELSQADTLGRLARILADLIKDGDLEDRVRELTKANSKFNSNYHIATTST